ncbi:MAG: hypothetical protein JSS09_04685 [Verrucomicrobia bacterium]|nr:hypothetical protein [Verrucomicrobiota bacterium]
MKITLPDPSTGDYTKMQTKGLFSISAGLFIGYNSVALSDPILKTAMSVTGLAMIIVGHDYYKAGTNLETFYRKKRKELPSTDKLNPQETMEAAIKGTILAPLWRSQIVPTQASLAPRKLKSCLKRTY